MYDTKGVAYPNKTKNICTDTNDSIRPALHLLPPTTTPATTRPSRRKDRQHRGTKSSKSVYTYIWMIDTTGCRFTIGLGLEDIV